MKNLIKNASSERQSLASNGNRKSGMNKIALFVLGVMLGGILMGISQHEEMSAHEEYYEQSEKLLDTLDSMYDWVDAVDPMEFYDAEQHLEELHK